jgi:hypothetical protein
MLRGIAGVIVGFIVMVIGVVATFGITIGVMGLEGVSQPGTFWTTNTFNIIVLIGGFIAALLGGWACGLIARNSKAAIVLAIIVVVMGIFTAVQNMNKPDPPARTGAITREDMMKHGKEPNWFAFGKVIAGALGVMVGSGLVSKKAQPREGI